MNLERITEENLDFALSVQAELENAETVAASGIIPCPILMFVSDGKQVSKGWIEQEREFAEQTDAKTVYLNCGHYVHYAESERIRREIRNFTAGL